MSVHNIKTKSELDKLFSNSKGSLFVIDFYSSWCGPCKFVAPHFAKMAQKYTDVVFIKVDIDEGEDLAELYDIKVIPTFYFIKNDETLAVVEGSNIDEVRTALETHK